MLGRLYLLTFFTWYNFDFSYFTFICKFQFFVFSFWSIYITVQKSVFIVAFFVVLKKNKDLMSYSFAANCNCMHSFEVFVMWDAEWIKQLWGSYSVAVMDLKVCVSKRLLLLEALMLHMWGSTFSHLGG